MPTKKTKQPPPMLADDIFMSVFAGEPVQVVTKTMVKQLNHESGEEIEQPLVINGFFVDLSTDHYYLGNEPTSPDTAIPRGEVSCIQIANPGDLYEQIFDDMPKDPDPSEMN